jgi:hypothetical protein
MACLEFLENNTEISSFKFYLLLHSLLLRDPSAFYCPGCTAALGLLCSPEIPFQYRFSSLMPPMKRQRSLTVTTRITLGSTAESPKTLNRQRAIASQRLIMCCTVSASCPQNLQTGSPSNRSIVRRCGSHRSMSCENRHHHSELMPT